MATVIDFSGRAHDSNEVHVNRSQLRQRIENVNASMPVGSGFELILAHGGRPEFLFTSATVRTPGQTTRKVNGQRYLAPRTIYDYLDLFSVLTALDPARAFAALRPIDMLAEEIRLSELQLWTADIRIVDDYQQRGDGSIDGFADARDRNSARVRDSSLSGIPRLPLMPEPRVSVAGTVTGRTSVRQDPNGVVVLVDGLLQRVPVNRANALIRTGRATWPPPGHTLDAAAPTETPWDIRAEQIRNRGEVVDDGRTPAMRASQGAWDDLTTAQREAAQRAERERVADEVIDAGMREGMADHAEAERQGAIDLARRALQGMGINPGEVREVRGIEGVSAEDIRGDFSVAEGRIAAWHAEVQSRVIGTMSPDDIRRIAMGLPPATPALEKGYRAIADRGKKPPIELVTRRIKIR